MIVPNVRSSFGRAEAAYLVWLLARGSESDRDREEHRLRENGLDDILDDPRTFNAIMAGPGLSTAPARLVFYLLVRHAMLEDGLDDRAVTDYLAALLVAFGNGHRAFTADAQDTELLYLTDILAAADAASGRREFLLRVHLGEFALWLSGLFPDFISQRVHRRGAPGLDYYEQLGATGFRQAARFADAERHGLDLLYRRCADTFPALRIALNRISDRHLFPASGDRIDRLLRQVADEFDRKPPN